MTENFEDSEKLYLKSIRRGCTSDLVFKRLGLVYIKNKKWKEARAVFKNYCFNINQNCGFAWRLLGMSYFKLRDMDNAEKCLEISNVLDNQNPDTWGMLSVICMIIGIG